MNQSLVAKSNQTSCNAHCTGSPTKQYFIQCLVVYHGSGLKCKTLLCAILLNLHVCIFILLYFNMFIYVIDANSISCKAHCLTKIMRQWNKQKMKWKRWTEYEGKFDTHGDVFNRQTPPNHCYSPLLWRQIKNASMMDAADKHILNISRNFQSLTTVIVLHNEAHALTQRFRAEGERYCGRFYIIQFTVTFKWCGTLLQSIKKKKKKIKDHEHKHKNKTFIFLYHK